MPTQRGDSSASVGGTPTDVESTFEQSSLNGTTQTGNARLVVRDATQIEIIDTLNHFLSTTVEGALQEIADATLGNITWGAINGTLSDQTDLQAALDAKVDDTEVASVDGTAEASKIFKLDSNSDISGINDLTAAGDVEAAVVVATSTFQGADAILTGDIDAATGTIDTLDGTDATFDSIIVTAGTPFNHQNLIINGDMEIAQRGTGFSAAASLTYPSDRFHWSKNLSTAVVDLYNGSNAGSIPGFRKGTEAFTQTTQASIAAGEYSLWQYKMEGSDFLKLENEANFTISFWAQSKSTGIFVVSFRNSAANRSYVKELSIDASNVWQHFTVTVPRDTSGTWSETPASTGISIGWAMACGSTYQAPSTETWVAGNYIGTSNVVNRHAVSLDGLNITGVQLQPGSYATPFVFESYSEKLARCRRYVQSLRGLGTNSYHTFARGTVDASTTTSYVGADLPTSMSSSPTISTTGNFRIYHGGGVRAVTSISLFSAGDDSLWLQASHPAAPSADPAILQADNDSTADIIASAEL